MDYVARYRQKRLEAEPHFQKPAAVLRQRSQEQRKERLKDREAAVQRQIEEITAKAKERRTKGLDPRGMVEERSYRTPWVQFRVS